MYQYSYKNITGMTLYKKTTTKTSEFYLKTSHSVSTSERKCYSAPANPIETNLLPTYSNRKCFLHEILSKFLIRINGVYVNRSKGTLDLC